MLYNVYMRVISKKTLHFPKYDFVIQAGVPTELPKEKELADAMLSMKDTIKQYNEQEKDKVEKANEANK